MCGDNPTIKQLIDYEQFCGIRGQKLLRRLTPSARPKRQLNS